jgi:hypothetical protein
MPDLNIDFEFNFASISLKPYSGSKGSSSYLLKSIINKLNDTDFPNDKRIINRYKNRKKSPKRELVIISNRIGEKGTRCFGRIALIKNKAPLLWNGKDDIIEEIEKETNKQFIEITNYSIHFCDDADPVIMFEFNSEGPRLSDIEFYIRQIAIEFKLAKNIETILHLKTNYDKLDSELTNVFGVTVKVNAAYTYKFDWFKALKNLNDDSGFKDVRLEMFFKRKKDIRGNYEKNIKGLDFARNLLSWLKKDKKNISHLEDLKMTYQISDDEVIDMDFLNNKVISLLNFPLIDGKVKTTDFHFAIGQEFNYYLKTGITNNELIK